MAFIPDPEKPAIREALNKMKSDVVLSYFTQKTGCDHCQENLELLEELCAIEDRIKLRVFDFEDNAEEAARYRISRVPATVVANGNDPGIRFYGIPAGYEFSSLLQTILMVSQGESGLSAESKEILKQIKAPVHLQVFVTPT